MNAVVKVEDWDNDELPTPGKWEMKELKPWHRQLCSMLAQGIEREVIARTLDCTPQYVSMLAAQPLVQKYMKEMCAFANIQLEAQFIEGVKVIGEVMKEGNHKDRLQAVRLNAALTHRIGSGSGLPGEVTGTNERLLRLAERLLSLQEKIQTPVIPTINGEFHDLTKSPEVTHTEVNRGNQPTQENGNGASHSERFGGE